MRRCGIYVRVACVEQGDGERAFAAQEAAGIAFCRKRGWRYQVFREAGLPGGVLRKLVDAVKAGRISHVFVNTVDRLSRNISQWLAVYQEIVQHGGRIVTPSGYAFESLIPNVIAAFREYESSIRTERRLASARRRNRR